MKHIFSVSLSLILLFAMSTFSFAAAPQIDAQSTPDATLQSVPYLGDVDVLYNPDLDMYVVTTEVGSAADTHLFTSMVPIEENLLRGYPDQQVTKQFSHRIYYSGGTLVGTIYTTITGTCSQVDNFAQITAMSATKDGSSSQSLSCSASYSGYLGTTEVYFAGNRVGTFGYRIYSNGTISQV